MMSIDTYAFLWKLPLVRFRVRVSANHTSSILDHMSSTGFEPMTSAMPGQCSHQLSFEATKMWRAGQFVGLICSHERNDEWKFVKWDWDVSWRNDNFFNSYLNLTSQAFLSLIIPFTCGLSLLVLYSALRGFCPASPVFPSHQKPTFDLIICDSVWFVVSSRRKPTMHTLNMNQHFQQIRGNGRRNGKTNGHLLTLSRSKPVG